MAEITIKPISAETARQIRKTVLRPDQPYETTKYPLDYDPDTLHVGTYLDGELVGVMTVNREAPPGLQNHSAWRMRGVAVAEKVRGSGYGRRMAQFCLDYVSQRGGELIWANGRTTALSFYQALGFQARGEEFTTDTGPHYQVLRWLKPLDRNLLEITSEVE